MNELECQLNHEREKRLLMENELDLMKHTPSIVYHTSNSRDDGVFKRPPVKPNKYHTREPLRHQHIPTPRPASQHKSALITSTPKSHTPLAGKPTGNNAPCSRLSSRASVACSRPSSRANVACSRPSKSSKFPFIRPSSSYTPSRPKGIPDRVTLFQRAKQGHITYNHSVDRLSGCISLISPSSIKDLKDECPGCHGTSLNSRNFLSCLSSNTNTCDYHWKVTESIIMKTQFEVEQLSLYNDSALQIDHEEIVQPNGDILYPFSPISSLPSPIQYTDNSKQLENTENNRANFTVTSRPLNSTSTIRSRIVTTDDEYPFNNSDITSRPLISCKPLQEMRLSPLNSNVLKPLDNHIIESQKKPLAYPQRIAMKQRVYNYDYSIPGKKKHRNKLTLAGKVQ